MTEPTQRPWETSVDANGEFWVVAEGGGDRIAANLTQKDAELIVRAVNEYPNLHTQKKQGEAIWRLKQQRDELADALRKIAGTGWPAEDAKIIAEAALKKVQ